MTTIDAHEDKIWALATPQEKSNQFDTFATGAADGQIKIWRDCTKEKEEEEPKKEKKEKKEEPESFEVENGTRLTPTQWDVMSVPPQRFSLVVKDPRMKLLIAVVRDEEGGPVSYVNLRGDDGPSEVECPQPFIYHIPPKPEKN